MNENYKEAPVTTDGGFGDVRADLNNNFGYIKDAFDNIDAAIAGGVVFGTYTGDGTYAQTIDIVVNGVAKQPKAVEVYRADGAQCHEDGHYGGLAILGHPCKYSLHPIVEIPENSTGFVVHRVNLTGYGHDICSNELGVEYYYKAYINGTVKTG